MVTVIFKSRLRDDAHEEYGKLAPRMLELAESMPGFVSFKRFEAADGERLTLVEFETHEQLRAWREHPEHREAQRIGRKRFYSSYDLAVCEPVRSYSFDGERRS